ncbi:MAG TPA: Spy/CpxP family protein refolding chaperone, partial [Pyrinomonadaceae bacterium]|nr:Spy/CpxP family protein refolding chaperone [Pyrinomonadaceae bacterium]
MKRLFIKQTAWAVTLGFILLFIVSSSRALAQNSNDAQQGDEAQTTQGNWKDQLKLTPDQLEKIRAIQEQNKVEGQPIRRRVVLAQRALEAAIYSENPNETEIEQRVRELAEAQVAQVRMRAKTELNVRRVLTPEQLNTFLKIRQQQAIQNQIKRREQNANQQRP